MNTIRNKKGQFIKGTIPPSRSGIEWSKEAIEKRTLTRKKNGYKHSQKTIEKIQMSRKKHYDVIGRTSRVRDLLESTTEYKNWHNKVLLRDNFSCQICGSRTDLQIHHKIPLEGFIRASKNDIQTLMSIDNLFDTSIGQTLCKKCHRKIENEKDYFSETFKSFIVLRGEGFLTLQNVKTGKVIKDYFHNMVVTFGKNAIAQRLAGQDAGEITYCALGTGSTAPALSDTALQTELVRKLVSVRSYSANVATFQTYFTTAEGNGTLREAGLFGNGVGRTASDTSGSGQLYCRTAINRTKTSNDTLTLNWDFTVG